MSVYMKSFAAAGSTLLHIVVLHPAVQTLVLPSIMWVNQRR